MTNREWLNTLTDEEFEKYLSCISYCGLCPSRVRCAERKINWLKAEHEEEIN